MVEKKLILDVCRLLRNNEKNVVLAVRLCKEKGVLTIEEARQLTSDGIPVVTIIGTVLGITTEEACKQVLDRKITYDDLLCILGIFAQDLMQRSQQKY